MLRIAPIIQHFLFFGINLPIWENAQTTRDDIPVFLTGFFLFYLPPTIYKGPLPNQIQF